MKKYWLSEMCEKCGMSLEKASALLGVSSSYLRNLETEYNRLGIKLMIKLSEIYGCRVKDLICEEEEKMDVRGRIELDIVIEKTDEIIDAKKIKFQQKAWKALKQGKAIHRARVFFVRLIQQTTLKLD